MNPQKRIFTLLSYIILFASITACNKKSISDSVMVFTSKGDINQTLAAFREQVGGTLNNSTGVVGGRREINWDGVPAELLNKALPGDFFNPTETDAPVSRQRGLVYSAAGGEFIASNNGFSSANTASADQFTSFSGNNSFANVSSSLWDAEFRVAGTEVSATVKGFGIVFTDVDRENNAFIEFFNEQKNLGKFYAPAKDMSSNFSFLGVYFKNEVVTKVRIGHEATIVNNKDISNGGVKDLIAFDDFIYSEPVRK
jgi:hypothetical protein